VIRDSAAAAYRQHTFHDRPAENSRKKATDGELVQQATDAGMIVNVTKELLIGPVLKDPSTSVNLSCQSRGTRHSVQAAASARRE